DVDYATFEVAKAACAADAIAEGILDFIKFGNGQTAPAERRPFAPQEDEAQSAPPPIALTLQGFFEALPRPLPEPVDDKTVAEINAPGWLNTLIQSARGGKLELKFIWTTDTKLGTHGAVLRLTRPGEVRTYMVEPQFSKRADAKSAVCLAALAADVGGYVRGIGAAIEAKISPEARSLPPEIFEYTKDRDACGCILTLKLVGKPKEHEKRSLGIAVVQLAFDQGAIEFLRFNGEPPPEGYKVELPPPRESKKAKRKAPEATDNEDGNPKKKPKLLSQTGQFLAAVGARPLSAVPMFLPQPWLCRSEPKGPYDYALREHGRQYEPGVGGTRYDGPGVYAPDPVLRAAASPRFRSPGTRAPLSPARSYPPEDDEYRRAYHESGFALPPPPGYDYDYGRHSRYTPPPPLPPEPAAHGYDDLGRRSGYGDDGDGNHAYGNTLMLARLLLTAAQSNDRRHLSCHPPPPSPPQDLTTAAPIPKPPRWVPPPPPSPPRVWQPGPHAPPMSAVAFSRGGAEVSMSAPPATLSSSSSSSTTTTPGSAYMPSKAPTPVLEPTTMSKTSTLTYAPSSCKEELIEFCKANGHPRPRFLHAPLDDGAVDPVAPRYKVWLVLGQERLELPTAYFKVEEGEEKVAKKVLQRLRA
ncbi:hypothetical protein EDB89DRAFT_2056365, partial [Lactarius sanguifluus]